MPSLYHFNPLLSEEKLHAVISLFFHSIQTSNFVLQCHSNKSDETDSLPTHMQKKPPHIHNHWSLFDGKSSKASFRSSASQEEKKKSPTNIDEVGWQEVAAGHTGGAHEGVPVRGNSGPGLQWWVGGVCHHGHSGSYRIHECCWLMDGSNGGCADWLTPHPNVIRHFELLRSPGGKSGLKMFLLKYMKVWLGQRKIPKSAAEVSLFSLCGVRLSNQSQVLKDKKKTNIKYEVEKRRPAGFKLSDNFQKHVLMSSRSTCCQCWEATGSGRNVMCPRSKGGITGCTCCTCCTAWWGQAAAVDHSWGDTQRKEDIKNVWDTLGGKKKKHLQVCWWSLKWHR